MLIIVSYNKKQDVLQMMADDTTDAKSSVCYTVQTTIKLTAVSRVIHI